MPTGFEKFAGKALSEKPIVIGKKEQVQPANDRKDESVERPIQSGTVERKTKSPRTISGMTDEKEERIQITIKLGVSTKDKLDWLKFSQKRTIIELTEEAIEDLYQKYRR